MTARRIARCSTFPEIRDRLIILNGWSKTWAMTGWRMGWSIWPNSAESGRLYDKVRKLAVNCWSCVNAPSQYAGIAAIDGPQDDVDKMMTRLRPPAEAGRRRAEPAARHFLHHAEGRLLCLPQYRQDRLEGKEACLGAARRGRRRVDRRPGFRHSRRRLHQAVLCQLGREHREGAGADGRVPGTGGGLSAGRASARAFRFRRALSLHLPDIGNAVPEPGVKRVCLVPFVPDHPGVDARELERKLGDGKR